MVSTKRLYSSNDQQHTMDINLNGGMMDMLGNQTAKVTVQQRKVLLSTEEIMRIAAAQFILSSNSTEGEPTPFTHPLNISVSDLTHEEKRNVHCASLLLAAVEEATNQQYDEAKKLLTECNKLTSATGNPVQRVVYYFSDTLRERIHRETGRMSFKKQGENDQEPTDSTPRSVKCIQVRLLVQQKLPFTQVIQFTSVQTIIDNVASAKRIHVIDLSFIHGIQWTILIHELASRSSCPVEFLKISAIGRTEEALDEAGKRLACFAKTLGVPFSFKAVIVDDMKSLTEDMFDTEDGEVVAVFSSIFMNTLIARPDRLENLMRVLRKLRPCVMTVADVEAYLNSPCFTTRFTEALFYYSALFDSYDGFMARDDETRMLIEEGLLSKGIRCIVATEGSERVVRHVGIGMWRSFFARYGVVEAKLSDWSPYQASLLAKQFAQGGSCSFDKNGKSLMIAWKGTFLFFISAWRFQFGDGRNI